MTTGRPARLDAKQIERIRKLHAQGIPLREIAKAFRNIEDNRAENFTESRKCLKF